MMKRVLERMFFIFVVCSIFGTGLVAFSEENSNELAKLSLLEESTPTRSAKDDENNSIRSEFLKRGILVSESPSKFVFNEIESRTLSFGDRLEEKTVVSDERSVENDRFPRRPISTRISEQIDAATGLKLTFETTTYEDFPEVVEWVAWFENVSDRKTPNLRDILAADVVLATGGTPRLWSGTGENADPKENYSGKIESLETGETLNFAPREAYPSYYAFPYFRVVGEKRSFTVAVGWPGDWNASFCADSDGSVRMTAGQRIVDLYLNPGEKIRTPRITILSYDSQTDGVNLWRRWFREYILPRQNGKVLDAKLVLDAHCGGELYKDITERQQLDAIRTMRSFGWPCDGLWIDAGWYLRKNSPKTPVGYWFLTGDWTPDPERFPNGMKPLADELGPNADLVLWFEPERIHRDAATFPEYRKFVVPDCEIIESYRMDMTSPETVRFLSELIGGAIRENGVGIYRQDSNGAGPAPFLNRLEEIDPRFNRRKGMAENLYVQGYLTFWRNLKAANPGLVIDSCASGGRRNDLETLRMGAVPLHYSDVGYFDFIDKQRYHDVLDQWFIYYKNIDAHDWDGEKNEYDFYKATVDFAPFTTLRPYIFSRNSPANRRYVERFLAVRDYLVVGDYYLLRGGFDDESWTVAQYHDPVADSGCLRLIRNEKNREETIDVRLKGICSSFRYRFENLDSGRTDVLSGREILENGYSVSLPPRSGAIVRYQKIDESAGDVESEIVE